MPRTSRPGWPRVRRRTVAAAAVREWVPGQDAGKVIDRGGHVPALECSKRPVSMRKSCALADHEYLVPRWRMRFVFVLRESWPRRVWAAPLGALFVGHGRHVALG